MAYARAVAQREGGGEDGGEGDGEDGEGEGEGEEEEGEGEGEEGEGEGEGEGEARREERREESRNAAFESLRRFLCASGGDASMLDGWTSSADVRRAGDTAGNVDVYFHAPCGRRFRSRVEVARLLFLALSFVHED